MEFNNCDSRTNEICTGIVVASTIKTKPMIVENQLYEYYPDFEDSDIGKDTSNMFADTMSMSNLYLAGLGADFDGDTVSVKGVFTDEANSELKQFMLDKKNFISFGCSNIRSEGADVVQSLYNMTKILVQDEDKISKKINYA